MVILFARVNIVKVTLNKRQGFLNAGEGISYKKRLKGKYKIMNFSGIFRTLQAMNRAMT